MVGRLNKKISDAVRKLSYRTTVDQLRRKGIQRVNVVGIDRIVALVEAAVHRSLKQRLGGIESMSQRGQIVAKTGKEFLKLLASNEELEKAHNEILDEKLAIEEERVGLLRELAGYRRELEAVQERLQIRQVDVAQKLQKRGREEDLLFAEELKTLLNSGETQDLGQRILDLVLDKLEQDRLREAEDRATAHDTEVERLNRRVNKLNRHLQETEEQLTLVVSAGREETGLASVYREVQGLTAADQDYKKKANLMVSIFEANVELRS